MFQQNYIPRVSPDMGFIDFNVHRKLSYESAFNVTEHYEKHYFAKGS